MAFEINGNGKIYARSVELKRMAKKALALGLTTSNDHALDLIARLMGLRDFQHLRNVAKDIDQDKLIRKKSAHDALSHVRCKAIHKGEDFPKKPPNHFTSDWKKQALQLLDKALATRTPGTLNFVALVGASDSGKTILANAHCARLGGDSRVIEAGLFTWFRSDYKPSSGDVVYMDRPASTKALPDNMSRSPHLLKRFKEWETTHESQRTLQRASEIFRIDSPIPYDETQSFPHESIARKLAHECSLVIAFPTVEAVQAALDQAGTIFSVGKPKFFSALKNWGAAHVVNLDDMTACTLHRTDGEYVPSVLPVLASVA